MKKSFPYHLKIYSIINLIPPDFGCDDSSPVLFASLMVCSTFSENVVNDFTSDDGFFFSGDTFADDESPPDVDLRDLIDLAGDAFDSFVVDGGFRLFCFGGFRVGEIFVGETF